jgi:hypothetical protein
MVGILMVVFFSFLILYDLKSPRKVGGFLAVILLGGAYYLLRKRYLRSTGLKLEDLRENATQWDT